MIRGRYLLVLLAMCGMTSACMGMLTNVAGLFFTPIADEMGVGRGAVSVTLTLSGLIFACAGLVVPKLISSERFKSILVIGTILFAGPTALLATASNLPVLYLLNAVRGFAAGVIGNVCITLVINNWFYAKNGFVTSIAMGFSGVAAAALSPVLSIVIESAGWRVGYLVAAAIIVALELPAILLPIAFRPQDVGLEPLGEKEVSTTTSSAGVLRTVPIALLLLCLVYAFLAAIATAYPQHFPGLADSYGQVATIGSLMISVCMIMNTAGKIVFGIVSDRLGVRRTVMIFAALVAIGVLLLLVVRSPVGLFAGATLMGFAFSLASVSTVLVTRDLFGVEQYAKVFPKVNLVAIPANAVGASLVGFAYDATGNYDAAFIALLFMMAALIGVMPFLYRLRDRLGSS